MCKEILKHWNLEYPKWGIWKFLFSIEQTYFLSLVALHFPPTYHTITKHWALSDGNLSDVLQRMVNLFRAIATPLIPHSGYWWVGESSPEWPRGPGQEYFPCESERQSLIPYWQWQPLSGGTWDYVGELGAQISLKIWKLWKFKNFENLKTLQTKCPSNMFQNQERSTSLTGFFQFIAWKVGTIRIGE